MIVPIVSVDLRHKPSGGVQAKTGCQPIHLAHKLCNHWVAAASQKLIQQRVPPADASAGNLHEAHRAVASRELQAVGIPPVTP